MPRTERYTQEERDAIEAQWTTILASPIYDSLNQGQKQSIISRARAGLSPAQLTKALLQFIRNENN